MSKSADMEKLEKLKKDFEIRKKAYESIEESLGEDCNRILRPRNQLSNRKLNASEQKEESEGL